MRLNTCLGGSRAEFCSCFPVGGRLLDAGALLVGGPTAAPSCGEVLLGISVGPEWGSGDQAGCDVSSQRVVDWELQKRQECTQAKP